MVDNHSSCSTDSGIPCVMPFRYNGKYYENCVDIDNGGVPWCYKNVEKKSWGICNMSSCQGALSWNKKDCTATAWFNSTEFYFIS